jgi:hypothetical protein
MLEKIAEKHGYVVTESFSEFEDAEWYKECKVCWDDIWPHHKLWYTRDSRY